MPDFALTPNAAAEGAEGQALVHQIDVSHNTALEQLAAAYPNVRLVDVYALTEAFAADPTGFGFTAPLSTELMKVQSASPVAFAPNEVAFYDGEHPTYAAHGVIAAFSDATLTSDRVTFLDGSQTQVNGRVGSDFFFANPLDPASPGADDDYTMNMGHGDDIVYAGNGDVTVRGGEGADLLFAGAGSASLYGNVGDDVLETNSLGANLLVGGQGDDALIANRGGTNNLRGGDGDDLLILKEGASLVNSDGSFNFGKQIVAGGNGQDTLRFHHQRPEPCRRAGFHRRVPEDRGRVRCFAADEQPRGFQRGRAARHRHRGAAVAGRLRVERSHHALRDHPHDPAVRRQRAADADGAKRTVADRAELEFARRLEKAASPNSGCSEVSGGIAGPPSLPPRGTHREGEGVRGAGGSSTKVSKSRFPSPNPRRTSSA